MLVKVTEMQSVMLIIVIVSFSLQCFDTVDWVIGQASAL